MDGKIPDNYYCQVLHYLAVTEYDFAVLKAQLKSEWHGELRITVKHYFIERKDIEEDIRYLVEAEQRFWTCVVEGHSRICFSRRYKGRGGTYGIKNL